MEPLRRFPFACRTSRSSSAARIYTRIGAASLSAMPNESVKQRAIEAIRSLPEGATLEDAIERLCFIAKVEEGLRQSEAGELIPHEEIKKQFLS